MKCRSCYDVLCLFACNCIIPLIGYNLSATYYPLVLSEFDTKWYSVDTNMRCLSFRTQILSWIAIHSDESLPKHTVVNHFFFQLCITNQPLSFVIWYGLSVELFWGLYMIHELIILSFTCFLLKNAIWWAMYPKIHDNIWYAIWREGLPIHDLNFDLIIMIPFSWILFSDNGDIEEMLLFSLKKFNRRCLDALFFGCQLCVITKAFLPY